MPASKTKYHAKSTHQQNRITLACDRKSASNTFNC